jgi:large subunit ribosomal protein L30
MSSETPADKVAPPAAPKRSARKAEGAAAGKSELLTIHLVRSGICTPRDQKATLKGLGFSRRGQQVHRPDNPAVRGMIRKVRHLVEVVERSGR